jgi:hypothetical protein
MKIKTPRIALVIVIFLAASFNSFADIIDSTSKGDCTGTQGGDYH